MLGRWPVPGKVKSRLAAATSEALAYRVYEALFNHTVRMLRGAEGIVHCCIEDLPSTACLPPAFKSYPQVAGDLGQRMMHAAAEAFRLGARKTVIIGTDCPALSADTLRNAFEALDNAEVVFGAAADGGYYLIGCKAVHPVLFHHLPWGTNTVLEDSLNICRKNRWPVCTLPVLSDVDTLDDLRSIMRSRPPWSGFLTTFEECLPSDDI